ncbi:anoctamin-like protein [Stylonychia lemnae]|uniref:Anoctamin-like protein n=1 Tax=Stylonychia lemnae TaxID=5949 RepID=A0A078ARJ0_STYLE|nr:anoctamin-like protein [Stylonychia lemnae]|eukprot:CDW85080.1 anoctamin-like protein [Stylonychia lemnae]
MEKLAYILYIDMIQQLQAAYFGHDDVLDFLLEKYDKLHLSVDPLDNLGFTPLLYACFRGYDEKEEEASFSRIACVKLLVSKGANVNLKKEYTGLTALHWAAFNEDKSVVVFLLNNKAILQQSTNIHTPLDVAGVCENFGIVETILTLWYQKQRKSPSLGTEQNQNNQSSTEKFLKAGQVAHLDDENKGPNESEIVRLRFDDPNMQLNDESKVVYDILFWASALGMTEIVSYVIRMGYSPFSIAFDEQNALMAAVENGRLETVKLILGLEYQSRNEIALYKAKYHFKDKFGNNPLHLAHKRVHTDVAAFLEQQSQSEQFKNDRNLRGLVPIQMNHRHIAQEQEVDSEPDYIFIVQKARAPLLESQLVDLKIQYKSFTCNYFIFILLAALNPDRDLLVIYFSDDLLDEMAEIYELPVRLLDQNQSVPFKNYAEDVYEQFQARQKQFLMMKIFEQEIDVDYYKKAGVIIDHFPLHDAFKNTIDESWRQYRFALFFGFITGRYKHYMQPLHFIARYYGEKMGFYFAYLLFYTSWLIIPAIPGLALFIYQMIIIGGQIKDKKPIDLDNPFNCLYCLVLAIWSTVFLEVWKRKESEIAHIWNMTGYLGADTEMPDYRSDFVIDDKTKSIKKENLASTYVRRMFGEIPSATLSIGLVVLCFWGFRKLQSDHKGKTEYSVGSSVMNAVIIVVLGTLYRKLATLLVSWENHQYQEEWENSLVSKHFAFQFVNAYIALFAVAFSDQDFNQLAQNLAIILAAKQIGINMLEVIQPWILVKFRMWKLHKALKQNFVGKPDKKADFDVQQMVEEQCILEPQSNVLVTKYAEIIQQFGYIVLFAQAFPLAPLLSIFTNFLEMKGTMNMMAYYQKRSIAQGASGIGNWRGILLSYVAIGVNCAIIYWTSNSLNDILDGRDYDETEKFMIIVIIEHAIIVFKLFLSNVIKDKPEWVVQEERTQQEELDNLFEMLDIKAEQVRKDGGKILEDQIKALKDKQKQSFVKSQIEQQSKNNLGQDAIEMNELMGIDEKYINHKSKKRIGKVTLQELWNINEDGKKDDISRREKKTQILTAGAPISKNVNDDMMSKTNQQLITKKPANNDDEQLLNDVSKSDRSNFTDNWMVLDKPAVREQKGSIVSGGDAHSSNRQSVAGQHSSVVNKVPQQILSQIPIDNEEFRSL